MKLVPNAFYVYVSSAQKSAEFYGSLFDLTPVFNSPDYVAFMLSPDVSFAVWSGKSDAVTPELARTSELGMNVSMEPQALDALHDQWVEKGAISIEAPHDAIFGRTFVVADPDGNLIRVAPVD